MLTKRFSEAQQFATDQVSTVTVSPSLLSGAANEDLDVCNNKQAKKSRRLRRQSNSIASHLGGWKVRMW